MKIKKYLKPPSRELLFFPWKKIVTTPHLVVLVFISPPAHRSPTVIVYLGILRLVGTSPLLWLGNRTVKYGPFQQISTDILPKTLLHAVQSIVK